MAYVSIRRIILPLIRRSIGTVTGGQELPARGPYLLAANHIDFLDGFVVSAAVDAVRHQSVSFITKSRNYWWTRSTIALDGRGRAGSLDAAFSHLQRGRILCNFIEGQRNPSTRLLPGRTGTARLALLTGVPVVPVGLLGPSGKTFAQSLANLLADPGRVTVRFGPPVNLDPYRGQTLTYELLQAATAEIVRALVVLTGKAYAG